MPGGTRLALPQTVFSLKGEAERRMDTVQAMAWELFAGWCRESQEIPVSDPFAEARIQCCLKLATLFIETHAEFAKRYAEEAQEKMVLKFDKEPKNG